MTQLSLGGLGGIHLAPDVLEEQRGAWCSPPEYTEAAGSFDIDPFSNPRSTVRSLLACWLERGDDAFGLERRHEVGTVWLNKGTPIRSSWKNEPHALEDGRHVLVDENYTCWIQPPYDLVLAALAHFGHTRFTALLRLDTSTKWFEQLWNLSEVIMVPKRDRLEFVPPPGVKASSNPFPHGLYYKRAADVPEAVKALCYPWPCPLYPWASDPLELRLGVAADRTIWRAFQHWQIVNAKPVRGSVALHLVRVAGTGTEDLAACGDVTAAIQPATSPIRGFALACTSCMAMTERA